MLRLRSIAVSFPLEHDHDVLDVREEHKTNALGCKLFKLNIVKACTALEWAPLHASRQKTFLSHRRCLRHFFCLAVDAPIGPSMVHHR